ncbi:MAG: hypothetical protein PHH65_09505 [Eubacteriales bacterium]|nr:hypothetical protein [Eubacteriales bacterium]
MADTSQVPLEELEDSIIELSNQTGVSSSEIAQNVYDAWKCDGDCIGCEYHAAGDTLSLDVTNPDGNGNMYDYLPDNDTPIEEFISDRILLEQLFARLRELDPEADTIIQLWMDHPEGISDRAIARELGRPQKTFADQMKKYRTDLRRITGDK